MPWKQAPASEEVWPAAGGQHGVQDPQPLNVLASMTPRSLSPEPPGIQTSGIPCGVPTRSKSLCFTVLTMEIHFDNENEFLGDFSVNMNLTECTYTNLAGTLTCTPMRTRTQHSLWSPGPRHEKEHEIQSHVRRSDTPRDVQGTLATHGMLSDTGHFFISISQFLGEGPSGLTVLQLPAG